MRASRARSHRSSLSASIHEESTQMKATFHNNPSSRLLACLCTSARGARCEDGIEGTCPLVIDSPGNNHSTMLRHLKLSKDVTMQRKNLSSVLLALVERHQRETWKLEKSQIVLFCGNSPTQRNSQMFKAMDPKN
uniref:Uncharacterized protein n=1 Tax=Aegilops tauschii TaxID=37682 RepID=R7WDM3_AEGTA